jgi:hypothetical protein
MNQLVYAITAIAALPFATLLVLACLSEIEALRASIKRHSPKRNLKEKTGSPSHPRLKATALTSHFCRNEVDARADAAPILAAEYEPGDALNQ